MTRNEFTNRTNVNVSETEYAAIEVVYMHSDLDKDEFCKMWCKMNSARVLAAKVEKMEAARKEAYRDALCKMVEKFTCWARKHTTIEYNDALTMEMTTLYENKALAALGIEIDTKMYMTCYDARKFLDAF